MTLHLINEDAVASYLKQNYDFFDRNSGLLEEMQLTHHTSGAISLIERQVELLRNSNQQLKKQLKELVDIAKDNDKLSEAMHRLTLDVFKAKSQDEIIKTTMHHLKHQFDSDMISLQFAQELLPNITLSDTVSHYANEGIEIRSLTNILNRGKPVCGKLTTNQLAICFKDNAPETQSAAIIPLTKPHSGECMGFIAIGSKNPNRFHISMGTVFLEHMGQIIGHALDRI